MMVTESSANCGKNRCNQHIAQLLRCIMTQCRSEKKVPEKFSLASLLNGSRGASLECLIMNQHAKRAKHDLNVAL